MAWVIKGESGAGLDATNRSFQDLRIESGFLTFSSLGRDSLVWLAKTTDAAGGGTIVPDDRQAVEIYKDGVRRFRGHVSKTRVKLSVVEVEVQGPWYWMESIDLTSELTDGTGADEERVKYVADETSLDNKIRNAIDRMIDLGVPMIRGGIADMFATPKITLSGKTCAAALTALVSRCPDSVVYFDYGLGDVLPTIRLVRRGGSAPMDAETFTVGANGLEDADIFPRRDLRVRRVEINYLDRHATTGRVQYKRQSFGLAGTGIAAGSETQKLTLSGDELVAFMPIDEFESVVVKSINWQDMSRDFIIANDVELAAIDETYGSVYGARAASISFWMGDITDKQLRTVLCPTFKRKSVSGKALTSSQKWLMTSTTPLPEWAVTELGAIEVEILGGWAASWTSTSGWNDGFKAVQAGAVEYNNFWRYSTSVGSDKDVTIDYAVRSFTVRAWLLSAEYASNTTIYKPMEYGFPAPPAGMAEEIRNTQVWVPWEGTIVLAGAANCTGANNLRKVINLNNTLTECATMKAPARSIVYDILRERVTWTLGPPPRLDYGTSSGRVPSSPQDLVELL